MHRRCLPGYGGGGQSGARLRIADFFRAMVLKFLLVLAKDTAEVVATIVVVAAAVSERNDFTVAACSRHSHTLFFHAGYGGGYDDRGGGRSGGTHWIRVNHARGAYCKKLTADFIVTGYGGGYDDRGGGGGYGGGRGGGGYGGGK
jgi:hypothetical protein